LRQILKFPTTARVARVEGLEVARVNRVNSQFQVVFSANNSIEYTQTIADAIRLIKQRVKPAAGYQIVFTRPKGKK
jgi:hypothetical protein